MVLMLVLIVDSNTKRQQQLRAVLASLGHRFSDIESCRDPETGAVLLRKNRYDICFAAYDRLDSDKGFNLLRQVGTVSTARLTPIVALSAVATRELVRAAMLSGAVTFLASPFSVESVEDAIRCAIAPLGR